MRVWLDDLREPPDGNWVWVTTPAEAIVLLELDEVEELDLDDDLGLRDEDRSEMSGHDVLRWIERQVATAGFVPPRLRVHSARPLEDERMQRAIDSINRRNGKRAAWCGPLVMPARHCHRDG